MAARIPRKGSANRAVVGDWKKEGTGSQNGPNPPPERSIGLAVLQANLNHARQAQDLFLHTLAERGCGLGIVAEPYCPPRVGQTGLQTTHSGEDAWRRLFGGTAGSLSPAVWSKEEPGMCPKWGVTLVIAVYSPRSWNTARFERQLEEIGEVIRDYLPGPVIVAGDLNAKAASWGCPRINRRGGLLEEWMAGLDLTILNVGSISMCAAAGRVNCRLDDGLPGGCTEGIIVEGGCGGRNVV